MAIALDHNQARKILESSFSAAMKLGFKPNSKAATNISEVILGTHLTFRYILVTNLLAKATNFKVHPLALQAGADLTGAFDSRSLCHKVFVPFEREQMAGKLGRSNEPYLNKPARFTSLSTENAVRKGYDTQILTKCITILNQLKDSNEAQAALTDALYFAMKRNIDTVQFTGIEGDATLHRILHSFGTRLITKSVEGETSALLSGLAFIFYGKILKENLEIRVHPVNQAGSSSNEILDIDVYKNKKLLLSAEIKDKIFTFEDVDHASNKVRANGLDNFFFILGPQAQPKGLNIDEMVTRVAKHNMKVSFVNILDFYSTLLGFTPSDLDASFVWDSISKLMVEARVKDQTRQHVFHCAQAVGLVDIIQSPVT